ncbi:MAG TPA: hypothetical protein VKR27_05200 [Acidimicrobiales bacterium]|nr:hypothetical protein [Acidimicrobiales bacterium]
MITTRIMELTKRRGLMITLAVVTIGIPTVFLVVRLLAHAFDPKSYGPAGGYTIFTSLVAGVLFIFGFIVAATLGCTAGSADLGDGLFRHLVVSGRSRLALYLARVPAGLAIIWSMVATGFIIVCAICVLAAPTKLNDNGVNVPPHLSEVQFEAWSAANADQVICNFPFFGGPKSSGPQLGNVNCGPHGLVIAGTTNPNGTPVTQAELKAFAVTIAKQNYASYSRLFLYPSDSLMIKSGLWVELEATIGFLVGLGLASLIGQRTVSVILMIVLELILTPIFSRAHIPHLLNAQRSVVGVAMAHIEPGALPLVFGGGGGGPGSGPGGGRSQLIPETTTEAIIVIVAWIVVWTALGAWRMMTRDA